MTENGIPVDLRQIVEKLPMEAVDCTWTAKFKEQQPNKTKLQSPYVQTPWTGYKQKLAYKTETLSSSLKKFAVFIFCLNFNLLNSRPWTLGVYLLS